MHYELCGCHNVRAKSGYSSSFATIQIVVSPSIFKLLDLLFFGLRLIFCRTDWGDSNQKPTTEKNKIAMTFVYFPTSCFRWYEKVAASGLLLANSEKCPGPRKKIPEASPPHLED